MPEPTAPFWDDRYSAVEYAYGTEPNVFFAQELDKLKPGRLLLPCDGEGRNAVYAARNGWNVLAIDQSVEGRKKALRLAKQHSVKITYEIGDVLGYPYPPAQFDAIGLCYAHFPEPERIKLHMACVAALRSGGILILEAFSKQQIGNPSGGPRSVPILYDLGEIKEDFAELDLQIAESVDTELAEGLYHVGPASVVRIVGKKPV